MASENVRDSERTRLLDGPGVEPRYDAQDSSSNVVKAANTDQVISRRDLYWIFAGTWSIVFLGALDGSSDICYFEAYP
jgi:hypothetical protein